MAIVQVVRFVEDCGFAYEGDTAYVEDESIDKFYVNNKQLGRHAWVDKKCVVHHKNIQVNSYQKSLWKGPL